VADAHGLLLLVPDLVIPDEPLNDLGHDGRFLFAHKIAIEFALVVLVALIDRDFETGDGMAFRRSGAGRRQGREAGLSGRFRQKRLETLVGKIEDRGPGTEVCRDLEETVGVLREKSAFCLEIGVNVGAAKAVDRLLRISHQE